MEEKDVKIYPFALETIEECAYWGKETWKLADLGYKDSKVRRGELEGNTMGELMETYMDRMVGDEVYSYSGRQFPVMVKGLKITERMPLLVCPDDEIASERYDSLGKLKLWYVEEADQDSVIYIGLKRDLTATEFYESCLNGSILDCMNEIPVKKGDCYLIVPGTLHCADKGVTLAEFAESSDLDLRICSWGREDDSIFLDEAFDFVNMSAGTPYLADADSLLRSEQFVANKMTLKEPVRISATENSSFAVYYCVKGKFSVQTPALRENGERYMENVVADEGNLVLVPAESAEYFLMPMDSESVIVELLGGVHVQEEMESEYVGDSED